VKGRLSAALTSLWLIVAVALVCRAGYAWIEIRQIPPQALAVVPFAQETGNIAYALASGQGFSSPTRSNTGPTAWLTPVYPALVAGIFGMFGIFTLHAFYASAALNYLFSVAACVPIYFAGRRIGSVGEASLAAWLWAVFPNAIVIPFQWIWDTSLSALLAVFILLATLKLAESRRARDWCSYGLLWGFTLMTNPSLGSLLPFFLAWAAWRARPELRAEAGSALRSKLALPALSVGILIFCCIPWTVRNYVDFHHLVPLRSNFPFELWLGNNKVFDPHSPDVTAHISRYEEARTYNQLGETAFMQRKWELATEFIRTHKRLELQLVFWRFKMFWLGSFHPVQDFERAGSKWIQSIFIVNLLEGILAAIGVGVLTWRRSAFSFPSAAVVIIFPLVYYATHASLRYKHPIDPILLLLAAFAIVAGIPQRRTSMAENPAADPTSPAALGI
jgi:hypothetical protein